MGRRLLRHARSEDCVPGGFAVNPNLAVVLPFMCHPDEETAIDRGLDGGHFFGYSLLHYYAFGHHDPGRTDIWAEFQENRSLFGFDRTIATGTGDRLGATIEHNGIGSLRGAVGTPDQVREPAPRVRGGRRRPGDLRRPGRQQPPRAHLRVARALRHRGDARVRRAGRAARRRRPSAWPRRSRPPSPAGSRPAPPTRTTRSRPRDDALHRVPPPPDPSRCRPDRGLRLPLRHRLGCARGPGRIDRLADRSRGSTPRPASPRCSARGPWPMARSHRPAVRRVERRYRPGTLVLETMFHTDDGRGRLTDCMPTRGDAARPRAHGRGRVEVACRCACTSRSASTTARSCRGCAAGPRGSPCRRARRRCSCAPRWSRAARTSHRGRVHRPPRATGSRSS